MSDTEEERLELVVKASGGKQVNITTSTEATVAELKEQLATETGIAKDQQRLIFSGRILKDQDALSAYKMKSGNAVHLVKGAAAKRTEATPTPNAATGAPAPSTLAAGQETGNPLSDLTGARYSGLANLPSASLFGPDGGQGPMPSMEDINAMLTSDPALLDRVAELMGDETNPMFNAMPPHVAEQARTLMSDPSVRALMLDPERMRQFMQASLQLQQIMGDAAPGGGRSLFGAGGLGAGGFPAPGATATEGGDSARDAGAAAAANPLAALGLPGLSNLGGLGGLGSGLGGLGSGLGAEPAETDTRPPEERYETQLRQLNELGFFDFDRNVRALRRSGGNVEGAVEALLDGHV